MDTLRLRACTVDLRALRAVRNDGSEVPLSAREVRLLECLLAEPGKTLDRDTLNRDILGHTAALQSRALDAMVCRLRTKIEADPTRPDHLQTMHGEGYRFESGVAVEVPASVVLVAVGIDPTLARDPVGPWLAALDPARGTSGGNLVSREGDEHLVSFVSPARAVAFCLAAVDAGASIGARGAACTGGDAARVRRLLAAAGGGRVLLAADLYGEVHTATGVRERVWHTFGGVRLTPDGPLERLVETGGDGPSPLVAAEGNLVAPITALVGRVADRTRIEELLDERRLVTLVGTGGVGKTRLSLEIGRRWREAGGGAWFCDLSACHDVRDVSDAVLRTLGLPVVSGRDPGEALAPLNDDLLVLDNAEQAVPAVRTLVERWCVSDRGARLLVTSRERLGAAGETLVEVAPLPVEDAVALFRGHAAGLGVDVPDSEDVRTLVTRLDGLPLAIALAAARTEVLPPDVLLGRLDERLSAIGRDTGRPPRHVDLQAMVVWSWELCTPEERALLVACTTFVGAFDLDDAEAVGGAGALDALHALRRRCLLRAADGGRLASWAAVRAFVLRTADPEALDAARDRHARWFARWGERDVRGPLLVGVLPDLLAAIDHAILRDPEAAVGAYLGAANALSTAGPADRIEPLAQRVLPLGIETRRIQLTRAATGAPMSVLREVDEALRDDPSPRAVISRLRIAHVLGEGARSRATWPGVVATMRALGDEARLTEALTFASIIEANASGSSPVLLELVQELLALCRRRGDREGQLRAHLQLSRAACQRGERELALDEGRRALTFSGGPFSAVEALANLAEVHRQRAEPRSALACLEQALELARKKGDPVVRAILLVSSGLVHAELVDTTEARGFYEQALALNRVHQLPRTGAVALGGLGRVELAEGRLDEAIARLTEAIDVYTSSGNDFYVSLFLPSLAAARAAQGDLVGARRDVDRAESLASTFECPLIRASVRMERALVQARFGDRAGAEADRAVAIELLSTLVGPGTQAIDLALFEVELAWVLGDREVARRRLGQARAALDAIDLPAGTIGGRQWTRLREQLDGRMDADPSE